MPERTVGEESPMSKASSMEGRWPEVIPREVHGGNNGMGGDQKTMEERAREEETLITKPASDFPSQSPADCANPFQNGKKQVMAENMGEDSEARNFFSNQVINADSSCYHFMRDPIDEAGSGERNNVGPQNIYVGQWDQIREKMV
ncbi:hypothetical protein FH972_001089 [Carpinus fangiana]|uniref:Uncharacterized protein n=1 Tax=Carpinus fangiana TaxID=176857 RepID=A0A5N6QAN5_9ROSI|nr:hypothetical protein FH972_001089 [Carpinus fangiana]